MTIHTRNGLDIDDLRELITGKLKVEKCPCCDVNGRQYWDGETGEGLNNTPSGINPEWLQSEACENCHGLGFLILERYQ